MHQALDTVLILLAAAVAVVLLCRRLQLPAMLGYLLVGIVIGPHTFGLIDTPDDATHLAEYGVVFLMFSLGLEFSLPKLMAMRNVVFGLGAAQVVSCMVIAGVPVLLFGGTWEAALVVGGAFAMSSTAIVSRLLAERVEINTPHGQHAIGILLFQDLAVVPLLIVIPMLGTAGGEIGMSLALAAFKVVVVLLLLLYFGPRLMRPLLHVVARQRSSELFVLNVLLITLGVAWLTAAAGLSLPLGAFLAGMLIAETEYRHQVEEDIRPFRDLLLGLFFITVGMRLDPAVLSQAPWWVLAAVAFLTVGKAVLIGALARPFGLSAGNALRTGLALGQGGEFGFVLLALATTSGVLPRLFEQVALVAILLSMIATPFLIQQSDRIVRRLIANDWMMQAMRLTQLAARTMTMTDHVILCGYGRTGQALARVLAQEDIPFYALDLDPDRVREAATAGEQVAFGDATRVDVLRSVGLARARALVVTYNHTPSALRILAVVRQERSDLPVLVRTFDDADIGVLKAAGADEVVAEVMEGSLMLASQTLLLLGTPLNRVLKQIRHARQDRYSLFRGFFHGVSDDGIEEQAQPRLHSVALSAGASAIGKSLSDGGLAECGVLVKALRRGNGHLQMPESETILQEGDVLVLQGLPQHLVRAERWLLEGE